MSIILETLNDLVKKHGAQYKAAEHIGVSPAYFCELLKGIYSPTDEMLEKMGLARKIIKIRGGKNGRK